MVGILRGWCEGKSRVVNKVEERMNGVEEACVVLKTDNPSRVSTWIQIVDPATASMRHRELLSRKQLLRVTPLLFAIL